MKTTAISDPAEFLRGLGGLHDAGVVGTFYHVQDHRVELALRDISWNLTGADGLRPRPCTLIFSEVSAFSIAVGQDKFHTSIAATEPASISEAYAITKGSVTRIDIVMSTSERWYVEFGSLAALAEIDFP